MFAKRLLIILFVFIVSVFPLSICYAESNVELSQAYVWEQNIDVYITGSLNTGNLSCKVSNQTADVIGSGLLADRGITVRTTILLDISTSMPSNVRGHIVSYIESFINNMGKNEECKIVVFGEQLTVLHDFTSDRYDLSNAAKKIEFTDQESKIYDAIYNTIPKLQHVDGAPCYYRTIVITDGVDDTVTGVTKEELFIKLQTETYPVDIVEVSSSARTEQNKELAALTRMSGGKYINQHPETDISSLSASLSVNNILWIGATIPSTLLDGSTRQINITDGATSIQFDIKVNVFDAPVDETPIHDEEQPESTTEKSTEAMAISEIPAASTIGLLFEEYSIVIYIGVGIGVIVAVAIIIALINIRNKKKKEMKRGDSVPGVTYPPKNKEKPSVNSNDGNPCILLHNVSEVDQAWDITLTKGVIIGRDTSCQICLADNSVSREQCKIYHNGNAMVENRSKSNKTLLNGELLNKPTAIKSGDRLKCGRITLIVDSIYDSDSGNVGDINKETVFINI